jgi:hypothetical protein
MNAGWIVLGCVILLLTFVDLFATTFGRSWYISDFIIRFFRGLGTAYIIHSKHANRYVLVFLSILTIFMTYVTWILLTCVGFFCLFLAADDSVVDQSKGLSTSSAEKFYFSIVSFSTAGYGDLVASRHMFFQLVAATAAVSGFMVLTLGLTYFQSVLTGYASAQAMASFIMFVGQDPYSFLINSWSVYDRTFSHGIQHWASIASMIASHVERIENNQVVSVMKSQRRDLSPILALVVLDEALTILLAGVEPSTLHTLGVPEPVIAIIRSALERCVHDFHHSSSIKRFEHLRGIDPPLPSLELLRRKGIPVISDAEFEARVKCDGVIINRRRISHAALLAEGWRWNDIYHPHDSGNTFAHVLQQTS